MPDLVLALSGSVDCETAAGMKTFWEGFYNIQNSLCQIDRCMVIGHTNDEKSARLLKAVYNPAFLDTEPLDLPESKQSAITVSPNDENKELAAAISMARALDQMRKLQTSDTCLILATQWNQGSEGTDAIIFDPALPPEYLYLAFHDQIDFFYPHTWLVAPRHIMQKFADYPDFIRACIERGTDNMLERRADGWPLALRAKFSLGDRARRLALKYFRRIDFNALRQALPFIHDKLLGLERRLKVLLDVPASTGENSLEPGTVTGVFLTAKEAARAGACLKAFIFAHHLRDQTRFLTSSDFKNLTKGVMINPLPFVYVITAGNANQEILETAVEQAEECLPENCSRIYLAVPDSPTIRSLVAESSQKGHHFRLEHMPISDNLPPDAILQSIIDATDREFEFACVVPAQMLPLKPFDKSFMNTLLHFLRNSDTSEISLVAQESEVPATLHISFPHLLSNSGQASQKLLPILVKTLRPQTSLDAGLKRATVAGQLKAGEDMLVSNFFPFVDAAYCTADRCSPELQKELILLNEKFPGLAAKKVVS